MISSSIRLVPRLAKCLPLISAFWALSVSHGITAPHSQVRNSLVYLLFVAAIVGVVGAMVAIYAGARQSEAAGRDG